MTGLDVTVDRILEAAVIVTDEKRTVLESFETAIFQPSEILAEMNSWCQEHHQKSGLLDRVPTGVSEEKLDRTLTQLAQKYSPDTRIILCGNSIHQDRKFVEKYLPMFDSCLHYRMLDVSSFKIVFREMFGIAFEKNQTHRALDDIRESIAELHYYLQAIDANKLIST